MRAGFVRKLIAATVAGLMLSGSTGALSGAPGVSRETASTAAAAPLAALTHIWTGNGADNKWSTPGNWTNGIPANGDPLLFAGGAATKTSNNDMIGLSLSGLVFGDSGYAVLGNPITLTGNIVQTVVGTNTVSLTMAISTPATGSNDIAAGGKVILTGQLGGSGSFKKSGAGEISIAASSTNLFSGPVTVNAGVLRLSAPANNYALSGPLVIGDDIGAVESDLVITEGTNIIPDTVGITINGTGLLDLNGNNETLGAVTLNGGRIANSGNAVLKLEGAVSASKSANGQFLASQISGGRISLPPAGLTFDVSGESTGTPTILTLIAGLDGGSVAAKLRKTGGGVLADSLDYGTFAGEVEISGGKYRVSQQTPFSAKISKVTVSGSAYLEMGGLYPLGTLTPPLFFNPSAGAPQSLNVQSTVSITGKVSMLASTTISVAALSILTVTKGIAGTGALTKDGAGTLVLTGDAASYKNGAGQTSTTVVNDGTLQTLTPIDSFTDLTIGPKALLDIGSLIFGGKLDGSGTVNIRPPAFLGLGYDNATGGVFSGKLTGAGQVSKFGPGVQTFSGGDSTFTGITNISNGQIVLTNSSGRVFGGSVQISAGPLPNVALVVNGQGGAATAGTSIVVENGARLTGIGNTGGPVRIGNDGTLAPGNGGPGTLTTGSLEMLGVSTAAFELGPVGGANDRVVVNGDLNLLGVLAITTLPGFGPGTYRLFDYTGNLYQFEMAIVTEIAGHTLNLDTSTPGQLNLIVSGPGSVATPGTGAGLVFLPAAPIGLASGW